MGQQHQVETTTTGAVIDSKIEPQPGEGKGINTILNKGLGLQKEESCDGAALPDRDFECLQEKDQVRTRTTKRDCALDIKVVG
jgi:hypothetical protein